MMRGVIWGDAPPLVGIGAGGGDMLTIDGRCGCEKCRARSENIYRMVGVCRNCGTKEILMIFRAGDPAMSRDCPICGNMNAVTPQRLATPDEIPVAEVK